MPTLNPETIRPLLAAVRDAARLCQHIQQETVTASEKADRSPVTIADYGSQAILCRALAAHFTSDRVIAEENGQDFLQQTPPDQRERVRRLVEQMIGAEVTESQLVAWMNHGRRRTGAAQTWVIDPIDGTKGFLAGRNYTIALGLLVDDQPVAGILGSPGYAGGTLFYALDGTAYRVPLAGGKVVPIRVATRAKGDRLLVVESVVKQHAAHDQMGSIYAGAGYPNPIIKRVDGQDKYGMVACGDVDLYLRVTPQADYIENIWDHAAGTALVLAAGGSVTDGYGKPLDYSRGEQLTDNTFVVVSSGQYHGAIIDALAQHMP